MTRLVIAAIAAAALAVPSTASGDPLRDTGQPESPGCFGELAATGAQAGIAGEFVRTFTELYKGNDGDSIGEDGVPFLKFYSCPGDYRGRNSLDDQP